MILATNNLYIHNYNICYNAVFEIIYYDKCDYVSYFSILHFRVSPNDAPPGDKLNDLTRVIFLQIAPSLLSLSRIKPTNKY